jgi:hypothetical protein
MSYYCQAFGAEDLLAALRAALNYREAPDGYPVTDGERGPGEACATLG